MSKRLIAFLTILSVLLMLAAPVAAATPISVYIDGVEKSFSPAPALISGSTLVPMRAFFESLGASVNYEPSTKTITSTKGTTTITLVLNSSQAKVDGTDKQLSVPAQLVSGSTFVPLRFVGEALGAGVGYLNGVITVTSPKASVAMAAEVHFIDVGQGDSILIKSGGKAVLIDAGEAENGPAVVNYLKAQGVFALDLVIGTHPHADHIGGLADVLNAFPVAKVIDSGVAHTTQTYIDYLSLIRQKNIPFETPSGQSIGLGEGARLDVLGPVREYEDLNNSSVVTRLVVGQVSFLLTGDMQQDAEADLVAVKDLKSTILKVGHHGSSTSTSAAFLAEVNPEAAVISVGEGNSYGHPTAGTLARLTSVDVFRTDEQGTIVITTDGTTYYVNTGAWAPAGQVAKGELKAAASMSNSAPAQNTTISAMVSVTKGGLAAAGAKVTIACHYKSTTSTYGGVTDAAGVATIPFGISRASIGYRVVVDVTVSLNGETTTASTSFTPR